MNAFPPPPRRRPPRRRPVPPGKAVTQVPRHRFARDATVPPDQYERDYCATCGCHGKAGDAHHLTADEALPPVDPDVTAHEHRRYGETGDD